MKSKTTTLRFSIALIAIVALSITSSCRKNKKVTEEEAVDFIEYALSKNGDGVAKQSTDIAKDMDLVISFLPCGATKDTSVHFTLTGNASADYTFNRHYELVCAADTTVVCEGDHNGYFESSRLKVTNSGLRQWSAKGIGPGYSNYTYNGNSSGQGTWISKVRRQKTINTSWSIAHSNVIINKSTRKIQSGTGTFTLNCSVVNGNDYTFTGTITYNGNGSATIVINGNTYTIQIY